MAVFGFPSASSQHAEDAVRAVLDLTRSFASGRQENEEIFGDWDMLRWGSVQARSLPGALKDSVHPALLASGEPIELRAQVLCPESSVWINDPD